MKADPGGKPGTPPSYDGFARRYGVRRGWLGVLTGGGVLMVLAFSAGLLSQPVAKLAYDLLTNERGPVQNGTFLCFLAAAIMSLRLAMAARRQRTASGLTIFYGVFAAICFVGSMEEISWGQAFFNFGTPVWLDAINAQGETTLHNLDGVQDLNSLGALVFALIGLTGVALDSRARFRRVGVPPALAPLFGLITLMATLETFNDFIFLGYHTAATIGALSEAAEMLGAVACLAYVWLKTRMLQREWAASATGARPDTREQAAA